MVDKLLVDGGRTTLDADSDELTGMTMVEAEFAFGKIDDSVETRSGGSIFDVEFRTGGNGGIAEGGTLNVWLDSSESNAEACTNDDCEVMVERGPDAVTADSTLCDERAPVVLTSPEIGEATVGDIGASEDVDRESTIKEADDNRVMEVVSSWRTIEEEFKMDKKGIEEAFDNLADREELGNVLTGEEDNIDSVIEGMLVDVDANERV